MYEAFSSSAGWVLETYAIDLFGGGLAIVALAWVWLIVRAFRQRAWWGFGSLLVPPVALLFALRHPQRATAPLVAVVLGGAIAACPLVYWLTAPVDLGMREKLMHGPASLSPLWAGIQSNAVHEWMETRALYMQSGGVAAAALISLLILWRSLRRFRQTSRSKHGAATTAESTTAPRGLRRSPVLPGLLALSLLVAFVPTLYVMSVPPNLGPYEKFVEGQRHLTLTGWDRKDYSVLKQKSDAAVLQMANPDVTDQTLEYIEHFRVLKELDLSNTQVTDAGLLILKDLPALAVLYLARTKITDQGFRTALLGKESLLLLDVQKTDVRPETIKAWHDAKPGRQAMH